MISSEVQRTLVKSPPELWAELGDPAALARQLGELGEIRIVRSEPETSVEWEAEGISGAIKLMPSGWGTKVTLTATRAAPAPVATPELELESEPAPPVEAEPASTFEAEPEPLGELEPEPAPAADESEAQPEAALEPVTIVEIEPEKRGFIARLFRRRRKQQPASKLAEEQEPERVQEPEHEREPARSESQPESQPGIAAELQALEDSLQAQTAALLTSVLDRLGAAHHRPFSRA